MATMKNGFPPGRNETRSWENRDPKADGEAAAEDQAAPSLPGQAIERHPRSGEWSWATESLARYSSGVDLTQLEERLKLTPTERLERMRRFQLSLEEARPGRGDRHPAAD